MPDRSVEVELRFDVNDYVRASTRLLLTKASFVGLLVLALGAVAYAIYFAIANASTLGFLAALGAQLPFLLFILIPVVLWFSLRRQGAGIIARQRKNHEQIFYTFSDSGFRQKVISDAGTDENEGTWDTFSRVVETPGEFLLLLPRRGGVFIPKKNFASPADVTLLRAILRSNLGKKAKLLAE